MTREETTHEYVLLVETERGTILSEGKDFPNRAIAEKSVKELSTHFPHREYRLIQWSERGSGEERVWAVVYCNGIKQQ